MTKTVTEITERLAQIAIEQAELSRTDHDALLEKAIVSGTDVERVEADQANAERLAKRLRIEHDTLTAMIPEAKRKAAAPALAKLKAEHANKIAQSSEVVKEALEHWDALQAAITQLQALRADANNLTMQASSVAQEAGDADPIPHMGMPISRALGLAAERMGYLGKDVQVWASMGTRSGTGYHGQDVDQQSLRSHERLTTSRQDHDQTEDHTDTDQHRPQPSPPRYLFRRQSRRIRSLHGAPEQHLERSGRGSTG